MGSDLGSEMVRVVRSGRGEASASGSVGSGASVSEDSAGPSRAASSASWRALREASRASHSARIPRRVFFVADFFLFVIWAVRSRSSLRCFCWRASIVVCILSECRVLYWF